MTKEQFENLTTGDLVRLNGHSTAYIVAANYGNRVTLVRTLDCTNPVEWVLVSKANHCK